MVLSPTTLFLISIIALVVGILSVIAGLGGGVFIVPILTVLFKYEMPIVVGTTLASTTFISLVGVIGARKRKEIDFKFAFAFLIPATISTFFGALITDMIPEIILLSILFSLALLLSIRMLLESRKKKKLGIKTYRRDKIQELKKEKKEQEEHSHKIAFFARFHYPWLRPFITIKRDEYEFKISIPVIIVFGLLIGFITGLLGSSGGWLISPLMILGFGYTPIVASGTSLFIILIKAIVGGTTHVIQGHFDMILFFVLSVFLPIGGFIGDLIKRRMKNRIVGLILGFCLLGVSAVILVFYFIL
ncbi:MAG: sulfite exporter TauE/SafE family protein [Candidatus Heimdallarchaeum aukensis]|uniref:Probable membrane transporter protein n=1 Tax=Candidatus Heimdallarchaeum aukensis TaxID=2876573 RepID=A0A9Y1BL44_9ARCH|nr:MAG: sulfite exporter TauE/SafE family protein [Candidatus Heimdallarchaeum aukensis]